MARVFAFRSPINNKKDFVPVKHACCGVQVCVSAWRCESKRKQTSFLNKRAALCGIEFITVQWKLPNKGVYARFIEICGDKFYYNEQ